MSNFVSPTVILGDPTTGAGSDDTTQGFRKYNQHTHLNSAPSDFTTYNIAVGDTVYIYDSNDQLVFNTLVAPAITYLSRTELQLSTTATVTLTATTLYIKAPKEDSDNAVVIQGVDVTQASNLITFNSNQPRAGFLSSESLTSLSNYQLSQTNQVTASGIFPVLATLPAKSWATELNVYLTLGSGVVQFNTVIGSGTAALGDAMTVAEGALYSQSLVNDVVDLNAVTYPSNLSGAPLPTNTLITAEVQAIYLPSGISSTTLLTSVNLTKVIV